MNIETKSIIKKHKLRLTKSLGQNFLIDESVVENIISSANITKEDLVIEIGPGIGNMTKELVKSAGHVVAIEIDRKLIRPLKERLEEFDNVDIINQDVMKCDVDEVISTYKSKGEFKNVKVVANLPYYITTPIIMRFLEMGFDVNEMMFMVQKEVADRMAANPGTKDYGALSLAVQFYTKPVKQFEVAPESFIPQPAVFSTIIKLTVYNEPPIDLLEKDLFFKVVKAGFGQRRKKLLNALHNSNLFGLEKSEIAEILENQGIDSNERGEKLSLERFGDLSNEMYNKMKK